MENIHVTVRVRPLSEQEVNNEEENLWGIQQCHNLYIHQQYVKELTNSKKLPSGIIKMRSQFTFDQCYSGRDSNQQIYNQKIQSIVLGSLNGINGTVFVYGQTGSGKTYTMLGPDRTDSDSGILFRSLSDLFQKINQDLDKTYVLRCSYFEIYNEQIFDLLTTEGIPEVLSVNEDGRKEFFIRGLTEESVSSATEVLQVVKRGETNRHYAYTQMNHHSSRSHTIFRLTIQSITNKFIRNYRREQSQLKFSSVEQLTPRSDDESSQAVSGALITESVLNFIDLAGSEKVSNHTSQMEENYMYESRIEEQQNNQRTKDRVKEGQYINKSLFFLTQVIYLKAEGKTHVPYRNSSLTKILRSSLGGNSRTFIILCINPTITHFDHTLSTLRFGMSAKKIENRIHANIQSHDDDEAIKIIISEYEKKIRDLEKARQVDLEMLRVASERLSIIQDHSKKLQDRLTKRNKEEFKRIVVPEIEKYRISEFIDDVGEVILPKSYQIQKQNLQQKQTVIKHDCQGALALLSFKQQKQRSKLLLNTAHQMITNYKLIRLQAEQEHIKTMDLEQKLKNKYQQLRHLEKNFQSLKEQSYEMAHKLDLNDLTNKPNQELQELKQFYERGLKQIQKEEWRREILNGIEQTCQEQCQFSQILKSKYQKQKQFEPYLSIIEGISENNISIDESHVSKNETNSYINSLDRIFFDEIDQNWEEEHVLSYEELEEKLKKDTEQKRELKIMEDININRFSSIPHSDQTITRQPSLRDQLNQINMGGLQNIFMSDHELPRSFTQKLLDFINDQEKQPPTALNNNDISRISRIQEESLISCDIPDTSMLKTTNSVTTISKARQFQTPEYRFRKPLGGNETQGSNSQNSSKNSRTPNPNVNEKKPLTSCDKKSQASCDKNKAPNNRKSMCSTSSTKIAKIIQTSVSNKKSSSKKNSSNIVKNTNRKSIQDENNNSVSLLSIDQSSIFPNKFLRDLIAMKKVKESSIKNSLSPRKVRSLPICSARQWINNLKK